MRMPGMRHNVAAFEMVPGDVKAVARKVSELLVKHGVAHAVIGGMAVSAYSPPRMTKDVDFVVPQEAMDAIRELGEASPLAESVDGVTVEVDGIPVDFIFVPEGFPDDAFRGGPTIEGIPVLRLEALMVMKMRAGRAKDLADVVEMLKTRSDAEVEQIRKWVKRHDPEELEDFEANLMMAQYEKSPDFRGKKPRKV